MKRVVVLLFCLVILCGCSNSMATQESSSEIFLEEPEVISATASEIESNLNSEPEQVHEWESLYKLADYEKFHSPASENGLAGELVRVDGEITAFNVSADGAVVLVDTDDGRWGFVYPLGVGNVQPEKGAATMYASYMGVSSTFGDIPFATLIRCVSSQNVTDYNAAAGFPAFEMYENGVPFPEAKSETKQEKPSVSSTSVPVVPKSETKQEDTAVSPAALKSESSNSSEPIPEGNKFIVFWGNTGDKVHISPECRTITNGVLNGSLEECKLAGHTAGWCEICSDGWTDARFLENGNPFLDSSGNFSSYLYAAAYPAKAPAASSSTASVETYTPPVSSSQPVQKTVYWGDTGKKIHTNPNCRTLRNNVHSGTEAEAIAAGRTDGYCKVC